MKNIFINYKNGELFSVLTFFINDHSKNVSYAQIFSDIKRKK
jgi:hypothetical protein